MSAETDDPRWPKIDPEGLRRAVDRVGQGIDAGSEYLNRPPREKAQAIADLKAQGAREERARIAAALERRAAVSQSGSLAAMLRHIAEQIRKGEI
jgi:hypothetical protein